MTQALAIQEGVQPIAAVFPDKIVGVFDNPPKWKMKAFTFVKPVTSMFKNPIRNDIIAGMKWRFTDIFESGSARALYIFTERCSYVCAVEFGVTDFNQLWETPALIADPSKGSGFGTSTLIASNRFVYESDQIRL